MTMQAVDGKHEGFMGHIISVAGVEVDGVVITSPYVHAISDKCALHFEEGSGLLSMSSVQLRYIGMRRSGPRLDPYVWPWRCSLQDLEPL